MDDAISLAEKLAQFTEHWAPRTIAQLNDYDIMVVKVQGEFVWHAHADTDDFFLVLKGRLTIRLRDREVEGRVNVSDAEVSTGPLSVSEML